MSTSVVKVLAIAGSLRQASIHRSLSRSLQNHAPQGLEIEVLELDGLPLFNEDIEAEELPKQVQTFYERISETDGLIWLTPEYNGSMSGVIKNALDWASRRKGLLGKRPATVISGSSGSLGGTKAQESLRASLNHVGMYVLARPALAIPQINTKLENDQIIDKNTQDMIANWLNDFRNWILVFK